jgi:hypothetical protein
MMVQCQLGEDPMRCGWDVNGDFLPRFRKPEIPEFVFILLFLFSGSFINTIFDKSAGRSAIR